jgi:hypothetical protein
MNAEIGEKMGEKSVANPRSGRRTLPAVGAAAMMFMVTASVSIPMAGQASAQSRPQYAVVETCAQSKATVERLRVMSTSQLENVFESLPANPPIPGGYLPGYGWTDANASPVTIQNLVHSIWQGKTLYNVLGTHIVNDVFFGLQVAPGVAHYTTSHIDGRGALMFDWTAYSPFYDEVRMVEPGVYVGFAFANSKFGTALVSFIPVLLSVMAGHQIVPDHPFEANVPYANLVLDQNCPNTWWTS